MVNGMFPCKLAYFYEENGVAMAKAWRYVQLQNDYHGRFIVLLGDLHSGADMISCPVDLCTIHQENGQMQLYPNRIAPSGNELAGYQLYNVEDSHQFGHSFRICNRARREGCSAARMVPLNSFTDDTSGNRSKKWNKFERWSLVPAALPLSERNKRENTFLVCIGYALRHN